MLVETNSVFYFKLRRGGMLVVAKHYLLFVVKFEQIFGIKFYFKRLQQAKILLFEGFFAVMFFLIQNILNYSW